MDKYIKSDKKIQIRAFVAIIILVVFLGCVYFFVSENTNEKGTPQAVILSSMGFEADVKVMLPVENEDAVLCVFQNMNDNDYLYVAYLEETENGLYTFGTEYDFMAWYDGVSNSISDAYDKNTNGEKLSFEDLAKVLHKGEPFKESFDDYEYFFISGKKDICVVYKIERNKADIPNGVNAKSFTYTAYDGTETTYYIYISDVEQENAIGYSCGIY